MTLLRPRTDAAPESAVRADRLARARRAWASTTDFSRRVIVPGVGAVARRLRIASTLGWSVLLTGSAALVLGLTFDWGELIAIAIGAGAVLLFAVPFVLVRAVYDVSIELGAERVVVGAHATGRLIVRNAARRDSPATRVELPVGQARAEFRMPRLKPGTEYDELFGIPTHRRAVLTLGPVTSVRSDPLGMLRREVEWTEPALLYVHPRVVTLDSETVGILRDLEGLPTRDLADDDVSFHALREYNPGDDLRHVHWTSTARAQKLMIRQFEQTRRSHLVLVLSTDLDDYADEDEFELAVSVTGSIGLTAIRDGKTLTVLTQDGVVAAPGVTRFLDGLAALEARHRGAGIDTVARSITTHAAGASVVLFVTGAAGSLAALRAASLRVPPTARSLGIRATLGEPLARRALGDLVFADVPGLDSLRMAMRAVTS